VAVNRLGQTVVLANDEDLLLVPPPEGNQADSTPVGFAPCQPTETGVYVAGEGIYLLTIAPAFGSVGRAPVSGLGNTEAGCNRKYILEGAKFRLLQLEFKRDLKLSDDELKSPKRLRNRVAYKCFGAEDPTVQSFVSNPLGPQVEKYGVLDDLRPNRLTDCDVPLAILYWTAEKEIEFIDMWSVRRRIVEPKVSRRCMGIVSDRRLAETEAMFFQFQDHLSDIRKSHGVASSLQATNNFAFLPPVGFLPIDGGSLGWKTFLGELGPDQETLVDAALLRSILYHALLFEPMRVSQSPPPPIEVYRVPSEDTTILFARSFNGRLRVSLSPVPSSDETVQILVQREGVNIQQSINTIGGASFQVSDLPPGIYSVSVAVQDFNPVSLQSITIVGGQTSDCTLVLTPLPNGTLLVVLEDLQGNAVSKNASSVTAKSEMNSTVVSGTFVPTLGKWFFKDLPQGTYALTVVAAKFQLKTITGVAIQRGQNLEKLVVLVPDVEEVKPPTCILVDVIKIPPLKRVRFCMVLGGTEFTDSFFDTQYTKAFMVNKELMSSWINRRYYVSAKNGPKISKSPWLRMKQIDPLSDSLEKWLAEWQVVFNDDFPDLGIDKAVPAIFINPSYKPMTDLGTVPKTPQAYAVFGLFGVPLAITLGTNRTPRPVEILKALIKGVDKETIKLFEEIDIPTIDEIVGLWTDIVDDLLEQEPEDSRYLISDARKSVEKLNGELTYYDGVDEGVSQNLKVNGYDTDVKLANADPVALGEKLGDEGLAKRVIQQARKVVSEDAWNLSTIGLADRQLDALKAIGVTSRGQLVDISAKSDEANRSVLVKVLGIESLDAAGQNAFIDDIKNKAIVQMTKASAMSSGATLLSAVPGMSVETAEKLGAAGIVSAEDLAGATEDNIVQVAGVTKEEAGQLIAKASEASVLKTDIAMLAFGDVSTGKTTAEALKGKNIATLGDFVNAKPADIAKIFNVPEAAAVDMQSEVKNGISPQTFRMGGIR
jgi:hypothetical protein